MHVSRISHGCRFAFHDSLRLRASTVHSLSHPHTPAAQLSPSRPLVPCLEYSPSLLGHATDSCTSLSRDHRAASLRDKTTGPSAALHTRCTLRRAYRVQDGSAGVRALSDKLMSLPPQRASAMSKPERSRIRAKRCLWSDRVPAASLVVTMRESARGIASLVRVGDVAYRNLVCEVTSELAYPPVLHRARSSTA